MASMFDSNFSFGADSTSSSHISSAYLDCTSTDISPLTSRCSSPRSFQPRSSRDTRYDAWRPRSSITALTAQLESHGLAERRQSYISEDPSSPFTPSFSADDTDEGFYDDPSTPSTSVSDLSSTSDFDPMLWDLSMAEMSATSSPRPSLSLEAQSMSSYTMRRRQRQALVRLQCLAKRTPDLAMLIEECHPSSLPLSTDAIWSSAPRSNSTSSLGAMSGRIEKERASIRKVPRMRKRLTR